MKSKIEFDECLKDSPKFRSVLESEESEVDHLESKINHIIKACSTAVDSGMEYVKHQSAFATSLWELQRHFTDDKTSLNALEKMIHCLQEMNKFHTILLDQASRTVIKNLSSFVKCDIKEVKDDKNLFQKVSENLDGALNKNAQVNKNKPTDVMETENFLSATKSCFHHTALDYVNALTMLQARKKPEVLSTLLSYVQACSTYYHQGSDLCEDYDQYFKVLGEDICTMRSDVSALEKSMQNRHASVNVFNPNAKTAQMAGYLFKRTSKGFKTWNRRWFFIAGNQLLYRKRNGDELPTIMEDDLSICAVRLANEYDRRFCFEVISPTKSHMLQADSMEVMNAWMVALQSGIGNAIQNGRNTRPGDPTNPRPSSVLKKVNWEYFLSIPGNANCCDCGHSDPKWASINLGITLCIACSGVHRSLGVHYSKVRSLTLDAWEPEIVKVMTELGNSVINRIYEANVDDSVIRANENSERQIRENWIKAKYVEKRFVASLSSITEALGKESLTGDDLKRANPAFKVTRWSVKKLRRRLQTTLTRKVVAVEAESTADAVQESGEEPTFDLKNTLETNEEEDEHCGDAEEKDVGDEKQAISVEVVFGENLSEPLSEPAFCLVDSDEDSVGDDVADDGDDIEDIAKLDPDVLMYKASGVHNLPVMSQALALGASKLFKNADDHDRTCLHSAVLSGSVMAVEFLILNGYDTNAQDDYGYTPLHLATEKGNTAQAYLLLKNRAKHDIVAGNGKMALDIAVDCANADIVTLLRLTKLNEEIGSQEQGAGNDETYVDVMKDFSHFAINQPHRLQRKAEDHNEDPATTNT